jgi:hypothetical protein
MGEQRRRSEVWQSLEAGHQPLLGFQICPAGAATLDVRHEWRNAETLLAVNEEVDFIG